MQFTGGEAGDGRNSFCRVQFDEISTIENQHFFEFADVDRDGMVDMLFLADKRTTSLIVNYNMLKSPTVIME